MTQANDKVGPASAAPVEQELGLVERLKSYAAQRRAHPHIAAILGDCGTAAAKIERLCAELAEMTADRDSWADQASQRLQDALDLMAAERERCAKECDDYAETYPLTERNARANRRAARVLAEKLRGA